MSLAIFGLGAPELLFILMLPFSAALLGFWIWMLIDCATKEDDQNQKFVWILLIALVGFIGAPLYFFIRKLPRKKCINPEPNQALEPISGSRPQF